MTSSIISCKDEKYTSDTMAVLAHTFRGEDYTCISTSNKGNYTSLRSLGAPASNVKPNWIHAWRDNNGTVKGIKRDITPTKGKTGGANKSRIESNKKGNGNEESGCKTPSKSSKKGKDTSRTADISGEKTRKKTDIDPE